MERYTYEIENREGFVVLLKLFDSEQNYPPIFIEWGRHEDGISATFVVESELFRAFFTLVEERAKQIDAFIELHSENQRFITACRVSHDESDHDAY